MRQNITITGEILQQMASEFWERLPQYSQIERLKFSVGWLNVFKSRHAIKEYRRTGEAASVDHQALHEALLNLHQTLDPYHLNNIFNMDETALYWKMTPDGTLATEAQAGTKLEKARITVNFCCNSSGTEKLQPWFIGKARTPRAFGRAGVKIQNLPLIWRSNKKAWMTGAIYKEWLFWFDQQMKGRQVALLIDGFSAHYAGNRSIQ